ncbi:MAG: hypothetical protein K2F57_04665 [Candidatus Gastranaerophilales bacterium]|nr:hypothetical protein [Candidatus Gastranaerophilales bacterium]
MTNFASYILHSNIINFTIMLCILYFIVKKVNLGKNFDSSIAGIEDGIKKSDKEKAKSKKVLKEAKKLIDGLPQDIQILEQNSTDKIKVFKEKIDENTQKTIFEIEKNVERAISIEEKKISNIMTEKTSNYSLDMAKQQILEQLEANPELHNQFILNSLDELDKVKL